MEPHTHKKFYLNWLEKDAPWRTRAAYSRLRIIALSHVRSLKGDVISVTAGCQEKKSHIGSSKRPMMHLFIS